MAFEVRFRSIYGKISWTLRALDKMCCRKLLKYGEIIRITNKLSGICEGMWANCRDDITW